MKRLAALLAVILCLASPANSRLFLPGGIGTASAPPTSTFYVATTGDDSNSGSISSPFLTPARAQTAVRTALGTYTDITVYLRDGIYPLTSTLALTSADSATTGHLVTWASYPSETAVISGGVQITGWTACTTADVVCNSGDGTTYQATVTSPTDFREFYFSPDGTFANLQHRPVSHTTAPFPDGLSVNSSTGTVTAPPGATPPLNATWANQTSVEVVFQNMWIMPRCRAATATSSGGAPMVITLQSPCSTNWVGWAKHAYDIYGGTGFFLHSLENAYELLTAQGDIGCGSGSGCWYYNPTSHVLYYQPKSGENMTTGLSYVPSLDTLMTGNGVSNIKFDRLAFALDKWAGPSGSAGYIPIQSGYYCISADSCDIITQTLGNMSPLHGALHFTGNSHDITFSHTWHTHNAARGVLAEHGSQNFVFDAVLAEDSGGGFLQYGDITDAGESNATLQTAGLTIQDSKLNTGQFEYQDSGEVFQPYARGLTIVSSEFDHSNWIPIATGWGGWVSTANYSTNHSISKVYINGYCEGGSLFDCGGMYNNGLVANPFTISENYIKGLGPAPNYSKGALYPDESSSFITYSSNVVDGPLTAHNCDTLEPQGGCGVFIWKSTINNITVNTGWWSTSSKNLDNGTGDTVNAPTTFTSGSPPAGAVTIINAAGISAGVTPGP